MILTADWFAEWMTYHQLLHPHRQWIDPASDRGLEFYEGWMEAFDQDGITHDEATCISRILQSRAPGYPEKHLKAIRETIVTERDRQAKERRAKSGVVRFTPEQIAATNESADCPECTGTGWARRRLVYAGLGVFGVDLFCRCPHGRWRYLQREDNSPFEDLQALPEVWDNELSHSTWCDFVMQPLVKLGPEVKYLAPGEPAPERLAKDAIRALAKPIKGRNPILGPKLPKIPDGVDA